MVEVIESSTYTIKQAYQDLKNLDFGEDHCNIKPYLEKRLKGSDAEVIVTLSRNQISPTLYGKLQHCQPTSASVERSFSMLGKLLTKGRNLMLRTLKSTYL